MAGSLDVLFSRRRRSLRWAQPVGQEAQLAQLHELLDRLPRLAGQDAVLARRRMCDLYARMQPQGWKAAYEADLPFLEKELADLLCGLAPLSRPDRTERLAGLRWELADRALCAGARRGRLFELRCTELLAMLPALVGYAEAPGEEADPAWAHARRRTPQVLRAALAEHPAAPSSLERFLVDASRRLIEESGLPAERDLCWRLTVFTFDMAMHELPGAGRHEEIIGAAGRYGCALYCKQLPSSLEDPWRLFEQCVRRGLARAAAECLIAGCGDERKALEHIAALPEIAGRGLAESLRGLDVGHGELVAALGAYFEPCTAGRPGPALLERVVGRLQAGRRALVSG